METTDYKYDIAFSFLSADEPIARELSARLSPRYRTFVYSEHQKELAGTDGEQFFHDLFGKQARLVAVLYRPAWGERGFTYIEKTAIKNRAFTANHEFVKVIPLDDPAVAPDWLPRPNIWIGYAALGLDATATALDARLQELGSTPHEETALERAARMIREQRAAAGREAFLGSEEGRQAAASSIEQLKSDVASIVAEMRAGIELEVRSTSNELAVIAEFDRESRRPCLSLMFRWSTNSVRSAFIEVTTWLGHPPLTGASLSGEPDRLWQARVEFDAPAQGETWWVGELGSGLGKRTYSPKTLVDAALKRLLDEFDRKHEPKAVARRRTNTALTGGLFPSRRRSRFDGF